MPRSIALYAVLAVIIAPPLAYSGEEPQTLSIRRGDTAHRYAVEIADTAEEHERGLMHRKSLAPGTGMLFVWEGEETIDMWMKDTYIPLDILFIDKHGKISHLVTNTAPLSEELISSTHPVSAVLELPAGTVKKDGIALGDTIEHPALHHD